MPISQTYEIPANINEFRISKGITPENIFHSDLSSSEFLKIEPFSFDEGSDVWRETYKMQLIQCGVCSCPGYR
jgi:hypothetical protein